MCLEFLHFKKIKFTDFVNMITVKFPPYLRCSIVILDSSGAFPFLKFEIHLLSSSSVTSCIGTAGNRHKQNSRFCKEIREDYFRFWWRRVHEDASQGIYISKIEICFFTARILQNQRML